MWSWEVKLLDHRNSSFVLQLKHLKVIKLFSDSFNKGPLVRDLLLGQIVFKEILFIVLRKRLLTHQDSEVVLVSNLTEITQLSVVQLIVLEVLKIFLNVDKLTFCDIPCVNDTLARKNRKFVILTLGCKDLSSVRHGWKRERVLMGKRNNLDRLKIFDICNLCVLS